MLLVCTSDLFHTFYTYSDNTNPDIVFSGHTSAKRCIGVPMTRSSSKNKRLFKAVALQYIVCATDLSCSILLKNCSWSTEIATTIHELESQKATLESDPGKLDVLFKEIIKMCLWWVDLAVYPLS